MMNVRFNKIKNIFLAALAVLMLFLSFPQVLYAKNPDSSKIYVTDEAEILSDTKESKLQKKCKSVSKNCKTDVAVLTISKGLDYTDLDNYVRTFAKEKGYAYDASSSEADYIVYVIDMKSRAVRVVTSGIAKSDISQSDLQSIIDKTTSTLSDGNYYKACVKYTDITQKLLSTSKTYKLFLYMPIKLGIAAVIAIIVVLVMMFNAKTKMTVDGNTYAKNGVHVYRREDRFINTTVTTRTIETNNSSGGSSGGEERDVYFEQAGKFIIEKEKASIGMLQRMYKIGFNRAARIMDQLCDAGVVGPEEGTKPRKVLMSMEEFENIL